jgi:hypothetical protein
MEIGRKPLASVWSCGVQYGPVWRPLGPTLGPKPPRRSDIQSASSSSLSARPGPMRRLRLSCVSLTSRSISSWASLERCSRISFNRRRARSSCDLTRALAVYVHALHVKVADGHRRTAQPHHLRLEWCRHCIWPTGTAKRCSFTTNSSVPRRCTRAQMLKSAACAAESIRSPGPIPLRPTSNVQGIRV